MDVYSFAITVYELITLALIEPEDHTLYVVNTKNGMRPDLNVESVLNFETFVPIMDILEICWNAAPENRPSFEELHHAFDMG
jgi:hypothetical protein